MNKSNKKLNKGLMIIFIGIVMTLFSLFIMKLWLNNFELRKEPLKVIQLKNSNNK